MTSAYATQALQIFEQMLLTDPDSAEDLLKYIENFARQRAPTEAEAKEAEKRAKAEAKEAEKRAKAEAKEAEKRAKAEAKKKPTREDNPAPEPTPEPVVYEADQWLEEEEVVLDVERFEHDGINYLRDPLANVLYDPETQEPVRRWLPDEGRVAEFGPEA